jgi:sugar transferase (PEP-CTERM/EpsH1 system associated)
MDILFLSHCVPNPHRKGERIRAFQEILALSEGHKVHLACFARNRKELDLAENLYKHCHSVYAEVRPFRKAILSAGARFCGGDSLNMAFYSSSTMHRYVDRLSSRIKLSAALAYTLPMTAYVPPGIVKALDLVDIDSEKWLRYAGLRWPGLFFNLEAKRLRERERHYGSLFDATFLCSHQEAELFRRISDASGECVENGVDFDYFDPSKRPADIHCPAPFVTFVGTLNYFPNVDGVAWFAREVMPALRSRNPELEFWIVGAEPDRRALRLDSCPGVRVIGPVDDVRPYILQARAVVAPLRLARGMQNKVLEAMALGRRVYATSEICRTFGADVPPALVRCDSVSEFVTAISSATSRPASPDIEIREETQARFTWKRNFAALTSRIDSLIDARHERHRPAVVDGRGYAVPRL